MLLLLVRHGETEANLEKRFQGQVNYLLNSRGKRQARQLAKRLRGYRLQEIYASDLQRAEETARIIAVSQQKSFFSHPLFREFSWGVIEGLTRKEIMSVYPSLSKRTKKDFANEPLPVQESSSCFQRRIKQASTFFQNSPENKSILLVSHGRFINALLTFVLLHREGPPFSFPVALSSLSAIMLRGEIAEALFLNDIAHL